MRNKIFISFSFLFLHFLFADAQTAYYPDTAWQVKTPAELKMNKLLLDSAVNFALTHENKVDKDLRIANLKEYCNEQDHKKLGPMKETAGPVGLIIKNGYIVAQLGDISRVDMTFSSTKSFLSTTAGLAIDN